MTRLYSKVVILSTRKNGSALPNNRITYEYLQMKIQLGNESYIFKEMRNCLDMKDGNWVIPEKMLNSLIR